MRSRRSSDCPRPRDDGHRAARDVGPRGGRAHHGDCTRTDPRTLGAGRFRLAGLGRGSRGRRPGRVAEGRRRPARPRRSRRRRVPPAPGDHERHARDPPSARWTAASGRAARRHPPAGAGDRRLLVDGRAARAAQAARLPAALVRTSHPDRPAHHSGFADGLASWLDTSVPLPVQIGRAGELVEHGVWLAPEMRTCCSTWADGSRCAQGRRQSQRALGGRALAEPRRGPRPRRRRGRAHGHGPGRSRREQLPCARRAVLRSRRTRPPPRSTECLAPPQNEASTGCCR